MADVGSIGFIGGAIAATGALGTAASGLVDASKAFGGGISNVGFKRIQAALHPFHGALQSAQSDWVATIRANWINGTPMEDQKTTAKSLIRLGLSSKNAAGMAAAGHVNPTDLVATVTAIEKGAALTPDQVTLLGRFSAAIDAAMDGGFERADQEYRNASKLWAGIAAVVLAACGGWLVGTPHMDPVDYLRSVEFGEAILVGIIAVPLAPVAKDLTSSLQAAVTALKAMKS